MDHKDKDVSAGSEVEEDSGALHPQLALDASGLFSIEWQGTPTRVHYNAVKYNNFIYSVGDCVHLANPDDDEAPFIAQIQGLFSTDGKLMLQSKWFYKPEDTKQTKVSKTAHERELYLSDDVVDENPIGSIIGLVQVKHKPDITDFSAWIEQENHYFYERAYTEATSTWRYVYIYDEKNDNPASEKEKEEEPIAKRLRFSRVNNNNGVSTTVPFANTKKPIGKKNVIFGDLIREEAGERFYASFERDGHTYSEGNHVLLRPEIPTNDPYIGEILSIFTDTKGTPTVEVRWFFAFKDLAPHVQETLKNDPTELYASVDSDYTSISAILDPCSVLKFHDIAEGIVDYITKPSNFYYRQWYDSQNLVLCDNPPEPVMWEPKIHRKSKKSKTDSPTKSLQQRGKTNAANLKSSPYIALEKALIPDSTHAAPNTECYISIDIYQPECANTPEKQKRDTSETPKKNSKKSRGKKRKEAEKTQIESNAEKEVQKSSEGSTGELEHEEEGETEKDEELQSGTPAEIKAKRNEGPVPKKACNKEVDTANARVTRSTSRTSIIRISNSKDELVHITAETTSPTTSPAPTSLNVPPEPPKPPTPLAPSKAPPMPTAKKRAAAKKKARN